jgi:hypothetical protein
MQSSDCSAYIEKRFGKQKGKYYRLFVTFPFSPFQSPLFQMESKLQEKLMKTFMDVKRQLILKPNLLN